MVTLYAEEDADGRVVSFGRHGIGIGNGVYGFIQGVRMLQHTVDVVSGLVILSQLHWIV